MKRFMMTILTLATLISGAALMQTKYTVQEKARELEALADQIHADRKAIRVLRAEWAYRTSPSKLQDQSMEYLALMPVLPSQVLHDVEDIPFRRNPLEPVAGAVGILLPGVKAKETNPNSKGSGAEAESVTRTAGRHQQEARSMLVRLSAQRDEKL
jgi:hypothetical protein